MRFRGIAAAKYRTPAVRHGIYAADVAEYTVKPLRRDTWDAPAHLVGRHNGVWGGCWCLSFHPKFYQIVLIGLVAIVGCSSDQIAASPLDADEARRLWEGNRPTTYEMTFRVECGLCYWSTGGTTVVVGPDSEPDGEATNPNEVTVDVLFQAIEAWLRSGPLDRYQATFDVDLGYPTFISIDGSEAIDDEWTFSLVSFEPVNSN